jgi:hypothetical protein
MASGTTFFDNAVGVDYLYGYTTPANGPTLTAATITTATITTANTTTENVTTINATTITAAANAGTVSHALPGTTLTAAGTFAPTFASGYVVINVAAGTNTAFVLTTTGLKVGGEYTFINRVAPTSGTYTLTTSAGTFLGAGTAGTVANFAGANYAFKVLVLATNVFNVVANVGTVTFA